MVHKGSYVDVYGLAIPIPRPRLTGLALEPPAGVEVTDDAGDGALHQALPGGGVLDEGADGHGDLDHPRRRLSFSPDPVFVLPGCLVGRGLSLGRLAVDLPRTIAPHLEVDSLGLDPGLSSESLIAADDDLAPAAVAGDPEHVPDHVGIGLARGEAPAVIPEKRIAAPVIPVEAFGPASPVVLDEVFRFQPLGQVAFAARDRGLLPGAAGNGAERVLRVANGGRCGFVSDHQPLPSARSRGAAAWSMRASTQAAT